MMSSSTRPRRVGVLGAGSWGTALGHDLARNGHRAVLWSHDPAIATAINEERCNRKYLAGVELADGVTATPDMSEALSGSDVVLCATPSRYVRDVFERARPHMPDEPLLVSGTKGIEVETGLRMSQVIGEVLDAPWTRRIVAFSGPSFADELARALPTAIAAASGVEECAITCQELFQSDHFRIYTGSDVVGTELGGALKNVIALAAGISDGLELGNNARAGLLTRGLAEISRLARDMGGSESTLAGLAGVGDLILTCTADLSRNRRAGLALGRGASLDEALEQVQEVVEGVPTARAARRLAHRRGVEMPIVDAVYSILDEGVRPRDALARLMAREPKPERW